MLLNSSMMRTTFLLLLISLHVSGNIYGPRLLTSHVGGSVTIKCPYLTTTANKHDRKYWCKESESKYIRNCRTLISTTDFIHEDYKTRVSMKDIPQKGILLVTMTQLKKKDSGRYKCGIGKNNNNGLYFGMNLNISEDPDLFKPIEMLWGKIGGSVAIKCSLEGRKLNEKKFLCKLRSSGCSLILDPNKFVFTTDHSGYFEVIMNRLRKEDSGMYKCGIGTPDNYASVGAVQLQVTEESVFSNILSYDQTTYETQTSTASSQEYTTFTDEFYKDSSSQTKSNVLSIVIPVLFAVSVLAATVIAVFLKIQRQKKYVPSEVDARNFELTEQICPVEHPKEENRGSEEEKSAAEPNKGVLDSKEYSLLGMPHVEEASKKN